MSTNSYGMSRFAGKTALVASGAAGVGRKTARQPVPERATVIAANRDVEV